MIDLKHYFLRSLNLYYNSLAINSNVKIDDRINGKPYEIVDLLLNFLISNFDDKEVVLNTISDNSSNKRYDLDANKYLKNHFNYIYNNKEDKTNVIISKYLNHASLYQKGTLLHTKNVTKLLFNLLHFIKVNKIMKSEIDENNLIGATLLHDIGKSAFPQIYIENKLDKDINLDSKNEFESMSIMLNIGKKILNHSSLSSFIAKEIFGLNDNICHYIHNHHGGTNLKHFYYNTLKQDESYTIYTDKIKSKYFTYPQEKPKIPESAILMIVDTVEASSRKIINLNYKNTSLANIQKSNKENIQNIENELLVNDTLIDSKLGLDNIIKIFNYLVEYTNNNIRNEYRANIEKLTN